MQEDGGLRLGGDFTNTDWKGREGKGRHRQRCGRLRKHNRRNGIIIEN